MNRNILNRSMFATGDEVFVPTGENPYPTGSSEDKYVTRETNTSLDNNTLAVLSQDVIKELGELGIDATNKTTKQLQDEIDSYIAREKGRLLFDPTDPLDYASAALTATGIGSAAGLGIKSVKTGFKGKQAAEKISKLQTIKNLLNPVRVNPGKVTPATFGVNVGKQTYSPKVLQSSTYGLTGLNIINPDDETNLNKAEGINVEKTTQEELNKLQAPKDKKELEKKKRKAEAAENDREIKRIEALIKDNEDFDKLKSQAYQDQKKRRTGRNLDIFLESMSASMAGTNNLADGLAIGAANAAKAVGDADEAEELARLEANKKALELAEDSDVSDQDFQDITKRYQESAKLLQKQSTLMAIVDDLDAAAATGNVTGVAGILGRLMEDITGFTGVGGNVVGAATKAVNQGKYLTAQSITEILQEGGKTVSDRDRDLIKDIMANFESWFMSKGEARDNLGRVRLNMQSAFESSQADLKALKSRFGTQIPELSYYDKAYGVKNESSNMQNQDDADLQLTQEDLID